MKFGVYFPYSDRPSADNEPCAPATYRETMLSCDKMRIVTGVDKQLRPSFGENPITPDTAFSKIYFGAPYLVCNIYLAAFVLQHTRTVFFLQRDTSRKQSISN